ncbi:tetratricopeptide repeat protein [Gemmatimonadota bacterium]
MKKEATSRGIALTLSSAVLIALAVGCAPPQVTSAKLYMNNQDYPAARQALEEAVLLYPDNAEAHRIFGDLEASQLNWAEAKRHFDIAYSFGSPTMKNEVTRIVEGFWQQYYNDGFALIQRQDLEGAIAATTIATILMPERTSAWKNLGAIHGNQGDFAMAIEMYNIVLDLDPDDVQTRQNIGFMYYNEQNYVEAVNYLEPLIGESINDPEFVRILGFTYGNLEQRDKAMALYNQALDSDPDNLLNHMNLAVLYVQELDFDSALPHYLQVVELNPFDAAAMAELAWIYLEREEEELAFPYLTKAMELNPSDPEIVEQLAVYYIRRGARLETVEDVQRGQELMQRAEQIRSLLGTGNPPPPFR